MRHRVAPDPLVDRLPLEHLALALGEQLQQLELAPGQVEALAADEGLELVGPDLELAGDQRPALGPVRPRRRRRVDGFDPGDRLLGVAGLVDPVVDAEPQGRAPAGRRSSGRCRRSRPRSGSMPQTRSRYGPAFLAEHGGVDDDSAFSFIATSSGRRNRAAAVGGMPAGGFGALGEDRHETAVVVDDRETDGLLRVHGSPIVGRGTRHRGKNPCVHRIFTSGSRNCGTAGNGERPGSGPSATREGVVWGAEHPAKDGAR